MWWSTVSFLFWEVMDQIYREIFVCVFSVICAPAKEFNTMSFIMYFYCFNLNWSNWPEDFKSTIVIHYKDQSFSLASYEVSEVKIVYIFKEHLKPHLFSLVFLHFITLILWFEHFIHSEKKRRGATKCRKVTKLNMQNMCQNTRFGLAASLHFNARQKRDTK